jgi:hypothetical protein
MWLGLVLILSCSACQPQNSGVKVGMNGFVLGDDTKTPKSLVVGVGESVDQFLARNPFLHGLKMPGGDHVLNLPLLTRADATYDDGEIKFHVGCSFTTNIDGNNKHVGINSVGFQLCDPAINDWTLATHRTAQLIAEFERQNPHLINLREFRKSASLAEAEKIWEGILFDRWTKIEFPLAEEQANQFFKRDADEGHVRQLQYNQNTYVVMAAFMNQKTSIHFGISKETYWGGENLTEEQKKTMKYVTVISFLQRKSAAKPCTITNDWSRCIP